MIFISSSNTDCFSSKINIVLTTTATGSDRQYIHVFSRCCLANPGNPNTCIPLLNYYSKRVGVQTPGWMFCQSAQCAMHSVFLVILLKPSVSLSAKPIDFLKILIRSTQMTAKQVKFGSSKAFLSCIAAVFSL